MASGYHGPVSAVRLSDRPGVLTGRMAMPRESGRVRRHQRAVDAFAPAVDPDMMRCPSMTRTDAIDGRTSGSSAS